VSCIEIIAYYQAGPTRQQARHGPKKRDSGLREHITGQTPST